MAITETKTTQELEKSAKETPKSKEKKERPFTKIVVRRLPPVMDLESFLNQVSPIPDYDYIYLVKGDMSLGENAFSRVYINFSNPSDIFLFKEKFDNYVFVNQKGHEYPAVVEFASFQKIPRKRKPRVDPKSSTIESDPYYLEFLESLKEQPQNDEKPEYSYQFSSEKNEVTSTPLLEYIKQRRIDKQRIREERRDERKRRELERKKFRDEERKRVDHKAPPVKSYKGSSNSRATKVEFTDAIKEESNENAEVKNDDAKETIVDKKESTGKEQKYEERGHFKSKSKFMSRSEKAEFMERKYDHRSKRDDYKDKEFRNRRFDDYKKDTETPRKTKKYSEKREERKNEAKRAEQKRLEEALVETSKNPENISKEATENKNNEKEDKLKGAGKETDQKEEAISKSSSKEKDHKEKEPEEQFDAIEETIAENKKDFRNDSRGKSKLRDHDPRLQRRIKNKDRPTMAIYQPGMLSKRKTGEGVEIDTPKD